MNINEHLAALSKAETDNRKMLHITAYENQMSETARSLISSRLSDRYFFGGGENGVINWDPFTTLGIAAVESIQLDAERAVKKMLSGSVVNLKCLSGVHAMMCSILVATQPKDTIMIIHHDDGGHFSTQPIIERTGRNVVYATFDVDSFAFDLEKTAQTYIESGATAFYLDISYPLRKIDIKGIRKALGDEAVIIYDASHTIGLMMGGKFQSPLEEGADIICANTHKTLPGPHKGMIVFRDENWGQPLNDVINNGLFSTTHTHHLMALAVTILEMEQFGAAYADQIIRNTNALGAALVRLGLSVREIEPGTFSHTHQLHLFLPKGDISELYKRFIHNDISVNFDDRLGGRLFARIGTQELTRRGMKEGDMDTIAELILDALDGKDVRTRVQIFNDRFTALAYSFDEALRE